jgi:DNA-binding response OmpR family regulator
MREAAEAPDDASMRDVLVAQCEAIARAVPAQSAEAALDLLERERVGAIILDPGLPGMDGLSFAQRLRKDARLRTLPIFLFSAREYTAEELKGSGIRSADAFVKTRDAEGVLFERLKHELAKHR